MNVISCSLNRPLQSKVNCIFYCRAEKDSNEVKTMTKLKQENNIDEVCENGNKVQNEITRRVAFCSEKDCAVCWHNLSVL